MGLFPIDERAGVLPEEPEAAENGDCGDKEKDIHFAMNLVLDWRD
jgi:hypothetical protein